MGEKCDSGSNARPNAFRPALNFRADGLIGGGIAFAIVGDHENRPTDYTNLIVTDEDGNGKKIL